MDTTEVNGKISEHREIGEPLNYEQRPQRRVRGNMCLLVSSKKQNICIHEEDSYLMEEGRKLLRLTG